MADTGNIEAGTPKAEPSSTSVNIHSAMRDRAGSDASSLRETMGLYGVASTISSLQRPSVPPSASRAESPTRSMRSGRDHIPASTTTDAVTASTSMSRTASASSTSALHSPAFAKQIPSSTEFGIKSAALMSNSPTMSSVPWISHVTDDSRSRQTVNRRQGPIITRIASPEFQKTSSNATGSPMAALPSPVPTPSSPVLRQSAMPINRPLAPRRTSGEMSAEDVQRDLAAGGLSAARYSRMNRSQSSKLGANGIADESGIEGKGQAPPPTQTKRYLDDEDFGDGRPVNGRQSDQHSGLIRFTTPPSEPLTDSSGRKVRNYQLHPGRNRFCFGGRALSSKDNPWPSIISFTLAFIMPVLFFAFSGPFVWDNLGGGGIASIFIFLYLTLIMWTSMCKTSWRDPGIVPRDLDPDAKESWVEDADGPGQGAYRRELRYIRVRGGVILSKWCETCHTYRPPRTSHCRLCDNCIEHTDHHCIGRRNYTPFIAFLISATLCAIYAICFSAWHIAHRQSQSINPNSASYGQPWATRWDVIGSFIVLVVSFGLACPIGSLLGYHLRLIWTNRTTIEMLRPKQDRSGAIDPKTGDAVANIWSVGQGKSKNISMSLCRPLQAESYVGFREFAVRDVRIRLEQGLARQV
ncbi:Eukaryotic peptide chain release factor GTP-binding subunit [Microbotryomycetes sp. JL201]|nr:Eukaryotic peptide chain release factor GTP-binding subunit [Microbotryomycetes sp. JL201]